MMLTCIFVCLFAILMYLIKGLFKFLDCFLIGLFALFLLNFTHYGYKSFMLYTICKYFSQTLTGLLIILVVSFEKHRFLVLMMSNSQYLFYLIFYLKCMCLAQSLLSAFKMCVILSSPVRVMILFNLHMYGIKVNVHIYT